MIRSRCLVVIRKTGIYGPEGMIVSFFADSREQAVKQLMQEDLSQIEDHWEIKIFDMP